jgi:pimeloyl-[acyl-carrier protein] synthase
MQHDFLSPKWRQDPYPLYAWLRENEPAHWNETWGGWLLTRYADVSGALRDSRLSLGGGVAALFGRIAAERLQRFAFLRRHLALWMGSLDAENHLRIRRVFQDGFRPHVLAQLRTKVDAISDHLIADLKHRPQFDVVNDFAYPLSAITMTAFIGAPYEDWQKFRGWADVLNRFLGCGFFTDEVLEHTQDSVIEMSDYFDRLLRDITATGSTRGLLAHVRAGALTTEEIIASFVVLLFGGYETTATAIGSCVQALKFRTEAWARVGDAQDDLNAAVEETMRFEAPVQMVRRCAVVDLEYGERLIKAGDVVWLVLGSANRDPVAFEDPDTFSLRRGANRHLAFGFGSHLCVGAQLSRMEAAAAIAALSRAMPSLALTSETVEWRRSPTSRSLVKLPATIRENAVSPAA